MMRDRFLPVFVGFFLAKMATTTEFSFILEPCDKMNKRFFLEITNMTKPKKGVTKCQILPKNVT
jgi:hypothetical protein